MMFRWKPEKFRCDASNDFEGMNGRSKGRESHLDQIMGHSESTESEEDTNDQPFLPNFQCAWEDEYIQSSFNAREMKVVCLISTVYFPVHFFGTVF
jgi:hypothetical protein